MDSFPHYIIMVAAVVIMLVFIIAGIRVANDLTAICRHVTATSAFPHGNGC
jgi:hypothetical protein